MPYTLLFSIMLWMEWLVLLWKEIFCCLRAFIREGSLFLWHNNPLSGLVRLILEVSKPLSPHTHTHSHTYTHTHTHIHTHTHTYTEFHRTSDDPVAEAATHTTQNKHKRRIAIPSAGYTIWISAIKWLQIYTLDRTATWIEDVYRNKYEQYPERRTTNRISIVCINDAFCFKFRLWDN